MINPFLATRINELPLRPLLLEVDQEAVPTILREIAGERVQPRVTIGQFSMIALPPVPSRWIMALNALPGVRVVHADLESQILQIPGAETGPDVWFPTSESRQVMGAVQAFEAGFTGESQLLGVIDTGIDAQHEQLMGSEFASTIMFPPEPGIDAGPQASGHGTHVASTAAGAQRFTPVQVFVQGVSRAPIFSVQCLGRIVGTGFTSEIINAIATAWDRGVRIFNLSLGAQECQGTCENCPECRIITELTRRGGMFCIAAGNSGPDPNTINCPGCTPAGIAVAAVDRRGAVARFSSRGGRRFPGKPDVTAPGVDIYSATGRASQVDLGDLQASAGYAAISGTSMATPHVAGLLALLRQARPDLTAESFKATMRQRRERNPGTGFGVPRWEMFV